MICMVAYNAPLLIMMGINQIIWFCYCAHVNVFSLITQSVRILSKTIKTIWLWFGKRYVNLFYENVNNLNTLKGPNTCLKETVQTQTTHTFIRMKRTNVTNIFVDGWAQ